MQKFQFSSYNFLSRYILECQTYTVLNTFDRKDTHSTVQGNERCDALSNGWYRFDGAAGTRFLTLACYTLGRFHGSSRMVQLLGSWVCNSETTSSGILSCHYFNVSSVTLSQLGFKAHFVSHSP